MSDWTEPTDGSADGHAAVGFVTGQRNDDGSRPAFVDILYRRKGTEAEKTVMRESNIQQVEFSPDSTVRFVQPDGSVLIADEVLAARPHKGRDTDA